MRPNSDYHPSRRSFHAIWQPILLGEQRRRCSLQSQLRLRTLKTFSIPPDGKDRRVSIMQIEYRDVLAYAMKAHIKFRSNIYKYNIYLYKCKYFRGFLLPLSQKRQEYLNGHWRSNCSITESKRNYYKSSCKSLWPFSKFVRAVELGEKGITVENLQLLCNALNISLQEFFREPEQDDSLLNEQLNECIAHLSTEQKKALLSLLANW